MLPHQERNRLLSLMAMYICLQIFIAGVAYLYDTMTTSFIVQSPVFGLGTEMAPTLFALYRRRQAAHVNARATALPSQVILGLQGDTTPAAQLLRELLSQRTMWAGLSSHSTSSSSSSSSSASASSSSSVFTGLLASPATNAIGAVRLNHMLP